MIGECMFLMHGLSTWMFSTVHLFGIFDSIPSVFFGFPLVLLQGVDSTMKFPRVDWPPTASRQRRLNLLRVQLRKESFFLIQFPAPCEHRPSERVILLHAQRDLFGRLAHLAWVFDQIRTTVHPKMLPTA